jgi:hypothetical protein
MRASSRVSNSLLALVAAGCVDHVPHPRETTSLRVMVTSPADLGSAEERLGAAVREVDVDVQALDDQGRRDERFTGEVDVFVHTLGQLSPTQQRFALSSGAGSGTIALPRVFGPSYLWLEDIEGTPQRPATYATGTSATLWFRQPLLVDVSTPDMTVGTPASWVRFSPLEGKQVRIERSQFEGAGRLVVTGVYADGYSVSDVDCSVTPCRAAPYGHVYVFSFSRPVDVRGRDVAVGHVMKWFEGGVAEFNGFTELNFPVQEILEDDPDESLLPAPVAIDRAWLTSTDGPLRFEELESGLVSVSNAKVCRLDDDWERFKQWKLDLGDGCNRPVNVISSATVAGFDPGAQVGRTLPRVAGALRTVNLGGFNVWIVLPRRPSDITTN